MSILLTEITKLLNEREELLRRNDTQAATILSFLERERQLTERLTQLQNVVDTYDDGDDERIEDLEERISQLEEENAELESSNDTLEDDLEAAQDDLDELEGVICDLRADLAVASDDLACAESDVNSLTVENEDLEEANAALLAGLAIKLWPN